MTPNGQKEEAIEITLSADLLGALGVLCGKDLTAISPLGLGDGEANKNQKQLLIDKNMLTTEQEINPDFERLISLLAETTSYMRFEIVRSDVTIQMNAYRADDGNNALLINVEGDFRIIYPIDSSHIIDMIAEYTGKSSFIGFECDLDMSWEEACAYAGMIDLQRRSFFRDLAKNDETTPSVFTTKEILSALQKDKKYQWLASILLDLKDEVPFKKEKDLEKVLKILEEKKQIEQKNKAWGLAMDGVLLSRQMLIIDQILSVSAGTLYDKDELSLTGVGYLQAGIHNILMIETSDESVGFASQSPNMVLALVESMLEFDVPKAEGGAAKKSGTKKEGAKKVQSSSRYCPSCGSIVSASAKFCMACGSQLP